MDINNNIVKELATFSQLNDDCLIEIFSYLDSNDLYRVSKVSERFCDIVAKSVMNRRQVILKDTHNHCSVRKFLKRFGPFLTKLSASDQDVQFVKKNRSRFVELCHMMTKSCHSLRHLSLRYCGAREVHQLEAVDLLASKLAALESVELSFGPNCFYFINTVERLLAFATKLEKIEFAHISLSAFRFDRFERLSTLILKECSVDVQSLRASLEILDGRLKHFKWIDSQYDITKPNCTIFMQLLHFLDVLNQNLVTFEYQNTRSNTACR